MTNATIDNSADHELNKTITWQFDGATHFVSIIQMLKNFFDVSTKEFWDGMAEKLNISNPDEADDYGLSVWGKLLGVPRPTITIVIDDEEVTKEISTELYRRIIVGRLRLAASNASVDAYIDFVKYVFHSDSGSGDECNVKVIDGQNMSLSFVFTKTGELTEDDLEQKALVENYLDSIIAYPAGVRSADESDGPVFGFYEQVRDENGNPLTTNLVVDNQSVQTVIYTYTVNGYTYTKNHKDFKIANLDNGTFAWNRFAR